jgi:hypothetical protein
LGTDTEHDVDVTSGECRDEDDSSNIISSGTLTFQLDATVGPNALDTGSPANNTWYALYVISKDDGTVATVGSTATTWASVTKTNLTGYNYGRRIGYLRTDGSANLIAFVQSEDPGRDRWWWWDLDVEAGTPDAQILNGGTSTSFTDCTLLGGGADRIPPGASNAAFGLEMDRTASLAGWGCQIRPNGTSISTFFEMVGGFAATNDGNKTGIIPVMPVGSDRIVEYDLNAAAGSMSVTVLGWEDPL